MAIPSACDHGQRNEIDKHKSLMIDTIKLLIDQNQFLSGGLVLGAFGVAAMWLRDVPVKLWSWARHYLVVTLTFDNRDELIFTTLVEYMHDQAALHRINNFTVRSVRQGPDYQGLLEELQQGGRPQAYLSPGEGFHLFMMDGHLMWMTREVTAANTVIEKIKLSTFGRSRRFLESLIEKALQARMSRELNKIAIYIPSPYNSEWMRARLGNNRRLSSVILKQGQVESILEDLHKFFESRRRYEELGIPWRRGYLLFGPPGTGKTSLVTALASELKLNVCTFSLASPNITDERIGNLLASVPPRSVILIEDIDSFFRQREKADQNVKLSYSGFLNALDGVASHEGSVIFLTTNKPELLDEAATRSGRVDYRMELSHCDQDQARRMFLKFHPDDAKARSFADGIVAGQPHPPRFKRCY
jgi:mitochondrial chaperone BCS1